MNDDSDSENDLEDIPSQLPEEWITSCSPTRLWRLVDDIEGRAVVKEEVERAMEYYCYLWETEQNIPHYLSKLIHSIFRKYLKRKQFNGALEAAFGFTGKQGVRNNYQRDLNIATDVAKCYLSGKSMRLSTHDVCQKYKLSETTVADAWKYYQILGIHLFKNELKKEGKDFTEGQLKRALKIEKRFNKKRVDYLKKTGT